MSDLPNTPTEQSGTSSTPPAGVAAPSETIDLIGDRYEVRDLLGVGGMGAVYRVFDRELSEFVALKLLLEVDSPDERQIESFRREVRLARRVTHVNAAKVFDLGRVGKQWFLTMELIEGGTLADVLEQVGHLSVGEACRVGADICAGLAAIHAAGIIHRDLKPSNVLLTSEGRVVVTDFGIARLADTDENDEGVLGTPGFIAPEQALGSRDIEPRTDLFGVGILLYWMLVGEHPAKVAVGEGEGERPLWPPNPSASVTLPAKLSALVRSCLEKQIELRPASAAAIEVGLRAFVSTRDRGVPEWIESDPAAVRDDSGVRRTPSSDTPAVVVSHLPFVGRVPELELLRRALLDAKRGVGGCLLLVGEPGIGKSRLADEAADQARAAGFTTLWGRCWEAGGAPDFWPWVQVLRALIREIGPARLMSLRSHRQRLLAQILPSLKGRLDDQELRGGVADRFELLDAITSWLVELAAETPLWICLEDLHAADAASLSLLEFMAVQLRSVPIVVVGTARPGEARRAATAKRYREVERAVTLVPLSRLHTGETMTFLELAFGGSLDRATRTAVEATTEGHPLFLVEITRLLQTTDSDIEVEALLPATVRATVEGRLARLSAPTRELLQHAAVAGREFDEATLASAFGLTVSKGPLREAHEAALINPLARGRWRFSHVRIPEIIVLGLDEDDCRELHGALANHLLGAEGGAAEVVHHLLRAGPGYRVAAIDACLRAGHEAFARFAFEDACAHYECARGLLEVGEVELAGEVDIADGLASIAVGDHERGRTCCERAFARAASVSDGRRMAEAALAYGVEFNAATIDARLIEMLERALEVVGELDAALTSRVLGRLAAARQPADDPDGPIAQAREAIELARRSGDEGALIDALRTCGSTMVDIAPAEDRLVCDRELLRLATRRGFVLDTLRAQTCIIFDVFELGRLDDGWRWLDNVRRLTRHQAPARLAWRAPSLSACHALWLGRLDEAEAMIQASASSPGGPAPRRVQLHQLVWLHYLRDDREALAAIAPELVDLYAGSEPGEAVSKLYQAQVLVWLGRVDEVRAIMDARVIEACERLHAWGSVGPLAEVAAALDDEALGARILARPGMRRGRFSQIMSGMTLRGPIERAMALANRALGRRSEALELLGSAVEICERHGGVALAERLRAEHRAWASEGPP